MSTTDYSKLKNAELESLLKERGLQLGGKKADMVARLAEDDQKSGSQATASASQADASSATTTPAAAAIAGGGTATRAPNPVDVPNQAPAVDPAATSDLSVAKDTSTSQSVPLNPPNTDAAGQSEADAAATTTSVFTSNLAPTDIDAEIAKRKARAAKFGISESEGDAIKALERAKRFGTGVPGEQKAGEAVESSMGMRRLDEALPERRDRKRGRAPAAEADTWEDEGLKRRRGRGGFRGTRGGRVDKKERTGGSASWMSEGDRAAAEKRKNRFATAT